MDDITLEKITYKNYIETIWRLKVKRCQKDFVASNNNSLAEAYVAITNGCVALPFAICKVISFILKKKSANNALTMRRLFAYL